MTAQLAGNVLPQILDDFRVRFPNIEVTVHDVIHEDVVRMVASGRVELGFGFEAEGANRLRFQPLFVDRFVAIVPPRSPLASLRSVSWAQLLSHNIIALQRPSTLERPAIRKAVGLITRIDQELSSAGEAIHQAVLADPRHRRR